MNFNDIAGQREVVESLKRSLSGNRIGHAYIFSGPAGMGKKTIAGIFASMLLCENPGPIASCGTCKACVLYANGTNPDFRRISPEDAGIGVDLVRAMLCDASLKPVYSRRKVYIIEDAEKMTEQAQNCLLKTLEEPPGHVVVILLAANPDMLIGTVRSRAFHYYFRKYTHEQVCRILKERTACDDGMIGLAADFSDGNIGLALQLVNSDEFSLLRDRVTGLLPGVESGNSKDTLEMVDLFEKNREKADMILGIMLLYYRDILVFCETGNDGILINADKKNMIIDNARMRQGRKPAKIAETIETARRALKQNANYQLVVDDLLFRLREDIKW